MVKKGKKSQFLPRLKRVGFLALTPVKINSQSFSFLKRHLGIGVHPNNIVDLLFTIGHSL